MSTTYTVTTSSELMENYLQADILLPQDNFIALQTEGGASLLFMIGTGNVLNLVSESPGQKQGWLRSDLSSAQIKKDFHTGAICKTFAAAQAKGLQAGQPAHIHLAMVVNDGKNDHLYLSLGNSDSDLSWVSQPKWTACPFNVAGSAAPAPFVIAGVFISEATDKEYIVVDTIANPGTAVEVISRFYMDLTAPAAPKWTAHHLAAEIDAAGYQTCLGRVANSFGGLDGLYTKGKAGPAAQLIYTPLYNYFNPAMPSLPSRLNLPGD